ncbi:FxsA family protein [Aestuariibacter salexigens]|uniref:FxsA family protein n=1 Tax=Aestuariibacter salexigens TaxID=226010 RepID=UPI0005536C27
MPIVEIALLINVGGIIGGWNTVAIVIVTAFVGAWLVRNEGIATFSKAQQKMATGEMPGQQMAEGLLLLVAGVLLVTPGFITDIIGFLLAMPVTRPLLARQLMQHMAVRVVNVHQQGSAQGFYHQQSQDPFQRRSHNHPDGDVFEGEYERKPDDDQNKLR